ncbi:Serine threonine kinase [Olea europaea subsp. europaea]|uniref:Serine threonine kinase n=1 Tax=Olea europaea subsp. europaea TaxID=158383 RepID=A0A8S0PQV2_OLEEU|nr:Serine threonine kinase [Olea europaea subsp. europaea]
MGLHLHLLQAKLLASILLLSVSTQANFEIAKPNCMDRSGNISIPFPFGMSEGYYFNKSFLVTCNDTHYDPPELFWTDTGINITSITLEGQLRVLQFIARDCYSPDGIRVSYRSTSSRVLFRFMVNNIANKFIVVGCDTYAYVFGRLEYRKYQIGCISLCDKKDDLVNGSCSGLGCCHIPIPKQVRTVNVTLGSFDNFTNVSDFNNCGYAFLAEESAFNFSASSLFDLRNVKKLPRVVDWVVGEGTCEEARNNIYSYACKSENSYCREPDNGYGYRCYCQKGYEGNSYLDYDRGCKDIDECKDQSVHKCVKKCENTPGGFRCVCPKGYHGDGKNDGQGCIHGQSLVFEVATGY